MNQLATIQLNASCILNVPLQNYDKDFSFIVNGEEFKTSHLIAELLSPNICRIRAIDPKFNTIIINTQEKGDFSHFLDLVNFKPTNIPSNELSFFIEVTEILENNSIEFKETSNPIEITTNNVLSLLLPHEKHKYFYSQEFLNQINFTSSHFYELSNGHDEEFAKLSPETLMLIVRNDNLQLNSEDDFLNFVNRMYSIDRKFAVIYEEVKFEEVSEEAMKQFNAIFDQKDMTNRMFTALSKRNVKK